MGKVMDNLKRYCYKCFFAFFLLVLIACSNNKDKEEIKLLYETIKSAEKQGNAEQVYSLLDTESKAYLDTMSNKLLHAGPNEIEKLNLFNRSMILTFRSKPYEEIVNLTGKDMMIKYHNTIMTMPKLMVGQNITRIEVKDTAAIAYFGLEEFPTDNPVYLRFSKEHGTWRYNLISVYESFNFSLMEPTFKSGGFKNKKEYLERVLNLKGIDKPYSELLAIPQIQK